MRPRLEEYQALVEVLRQVSPRTMEYYPARSMFHSAFTRAVRKRLLGELRSRDLPPQMPPVMRAREAGYARDRNSEIETVGTTRDLRLASRSNTWNSGQPDPEVPPLMTIRDAARETPLLLRRARQLDKPYRWPANMRPPGSF